MTTTSQKNKGRGIINFQQISEKPLQKFTNVKKGQSRTPGAKINFLPISI